ncbi:MAG TPA: 4Fe-4S dicluster domain-containing protein [Candidatus Altiarchaeales archaeon]|nr:4Fe-4S dicluster domain-containing protein [Candidatus Altiarchaeales archaeon]
MKIAVASGKGGTGKTTIAVNLALSIKNVQLIDCDVEEPNCNIFLNMRLRKVNSVSIPVPVIDNNRCIHCGRCSKNCQYNAIVTLPDETIVFSELCHGCGLCSIVCPVDAITEENRVIGIIEKGDGEMEFLRGILNISEALSTPIIRKLKEGIKKNKIAILDAPPGAGCPVIETISDVDYCVLVTEPTPFGLYDLKIMVELCRRLNLKFGVIINRYGIGNSSVENFCHKEKIPILMKISNDKRIMELYSRGIAFVDKIPEKRREFIKLFHMIGNETDSGN